MADPMITINGANRIGNKLRSLAKTHPEITDPVIGDFMRAERAALKSTPYPAPRPLQKYKRTGRLANSWKVEKLKAGVYQMVNTAKGKSGQEYAGFVVGKQQAWMHKGRWWIAADETQKRVSETLTPKLTEAIRAVMRAQGAD